MRTCVLCANSIASAERKACVRRRRAAAPCHRPRPATHFAENSNRSAGWRRMTSFVYAFNTSARFGGTTICAGSSGQAPRLHARVAMPKHMHTQAQQAHACAAAAAGLHRFPSRLTPLPWSPGLARSCIGLMCNPLPSPCLPWLPARTPPLCAPAPRSKSAQCPCCCCCCAPAPPAVPGQSLGRLLKAPPCYVSVCLGEPSAAGESLWQRQAQRTRCEVQYMRGGGVVFDCCGCRVLQW